MAYHIHTTDAYVLRSVAVGEANTLVFLFTRDLGLVMATAQGSRLLKSKLRYSLQPMSISTVSLVRGKNKWRVTNAVLKKDYFFGQESSKRKSIARIFAFLEKFIGQEEKNLDIFDSLQNGLETICEVSGKYSSDIEAVLVFRILNSLGYIAPSGNLLGLLDDHVWQIEFIEKLKSQKRNIISSINKAFKESQLG